MRATAIDHTTLPFPETFDFLLSARFVARTEHPRATCTITRRCERRWNIKEERDNLASVLKRKDSHRVEGSIYRGNFKLIGRLYDFGVGRVAITYIGFKMLHRSIRAITKMPAHFHVTFLIIAHTSSVVVQRACVSPPRRTRVALIAFFPSEKKGPARVGFNPLSKRDARKQEDEEEQEEAVEEEVGNEGCDGSATRSPPSRASSTCCWRATRPPRRPGRTYPAMNRGQLREGENAAP